MLCYPKRPLVTFLKTVGWTSIYMDVRPSHSVVSFPWLGRVFGLWGLRRQIGIWVCIRYPN